jgi:hypothetical protein
LWEALGLVYPHFFRYLFWVVYRLAEAHQCVNPWLVWHSTIQLVVQRPDQRALNLRRFPQHHGHYLHRVLSVSPMKIGLHWVAESLLNDP